MSVKTNKAAIDEINVRLGRIEQQLGSLPGNNTSPDALSDIIDRLSRLERMVETLVSSKGEDIDRSADPSNSNNRALPWGCPPSFADPDVFARMVTGAALDSEQIREKAKRAVIERVPEEVDAEELITKIAEACGVEDDLLTEEIHRHPREKREIKPGQKVKSRILKVPFSTTSSRDIFIRKFRQSLKSVPSAPTGIFARRDMTQFELNILYEQRRKAYQANLTSGQYKYVVVDLSIKELPHPKPLRTNK